jgi:hypothetical protein
VDQCRSLGRLDELAEGDDVDHPGPGREQVAVAAALQI